MLTFTWPETTVDSEAKHVTSKALRVKRVCNALEFVRNLREERKLEYIYVT